MKEGSEKKRNYNVQNSTCAKFEFFVLEFEIDDIKDFKEDDYTITNIYIINVLFSN